MVWPEVLAGDLGERAQVAVGRAAGAATGTISVIGLFGKGLRQRGAAGASSAAARAAASSARREDVAFMKYRLLSMSGLHEIDGGSRRRCAAQTAPLKTGWRNSCAGIAMAWSV